MSKAHAVLKDLLVALARRLHLFPFRTEKLSSSAPMVLQSRESRSSPTLFFVFASALKLHVDIHHISHLHEKKFTTCKI